MALTTKVDKIGVQIAIQDMRLLSLGSGLGVSFCKVPFHTVTRSILSLCCFTAVTHSNDQTSKGLCWLCTRGLSVSICGPGAVVIGASGMYWRTCKDVCLIPAKESLK